MKKSPPGVGPVAGARWNHMQREEAIGQPCLDAVALVALARQSPAIAAMNLGQRYLGRVIRRFIAAGLHERDLIGWVIVYADPTGEDATRHVMKERGW